MNKKTLRSAGTLCLMAGLLTVQIFSPLAYIYAEENEEAMSNEQEEQTASSESEENTANEESIDEPLDEEQQAQEEEHEAGDMEEDHDAYPAEIVEETDEASEANELQSAESADSESDGGDSDVSTEEQSTTTEEVSDEIDEVAADDEPEGETAEVVSLEQGGEQSTSTLVTFNATTSSSTENSSTTPNTTIISGQSIALANVLNMVNSNFVNSEGVVLFSNFFETVFGAIDFRQYFGSMLGLGCSLVSCQGNDVVVNVDNNASIDNEILVSAASGNNQISGTGNATINTGDAYAGLNLVNVANTNLVDSSYLLVTLNAFQDVNGDIVFPSLSQFFSTLAQGASTPEMIDIQNTAGVNNSVDVNANAGDNTISNSGSGAISTGNSQGSTNVFNQLNSSLIGGQSVSVVFRVHGSWAGEVFGAPDDLAWTVGDDGSIYLFDVASQSSNGSLSMHGTSTAQINNNVNVIALTGQNSITDSETAVISTGNAYAGANIINVANANVIGRNWILAVINIFGDFNGNIAFGRPDLWIGGQIDVPRSIKNGSELTYNYTIINNGDSPATLVDLTTDLNGEYLEIVDASLPYVSVAGGAMRFELGTLPAGGAAEISFTARVQNTEYGTDIVNAALVKERETDNNTSDNTEVLTVSTDDRKKSDGIRIELRKNESADMENAEEVAGDIALEASRLTPDVVMNIGNNSTDEKLILRNTTNSTATNVVLHDILKDESGTIIRDEVWELGDVLPGEEIELGYTISFNPNAQHGVYTLDTVIEGGNVHVELKNNGKIAYEALPVLQSELLSSFTAANESSSAFAFEGNSGNSDVSDEVFYGKETPLIPPLHTKVANAADGNPQLAAAGASGFPLDPILTFFSLATLFFAFALFRLYRRG